MTKLGDCYSVALGIMMNPRDRDDTFRLCHGTVVNPDTGLRHDHAWVEHVEVIKLPESRPPGFEHLSDTHLDMVIDQSNGNDAHLPRAWYYKVGQVEDVHRYTASEAAAQAVGSGHYGPWHEGSSDE